MTKRWLVSFVLGLALASVVSPAAELRGTPGTLTGTVTDLEGNPVAGLPLWAIDSFEQQKKGLPPSAVSGSDGSFVIPHLPPGKIELHACGKGYVHQSRTLWSLDEPVLLKVQPAVMLRGQVLHPDGTPVESAALSVDPLPEIPLEPGARPLFLSWSPCPDPEWAATKTDGRFELGPLQPGQYKLHVYAGIADEEPRLLSLPEAGMVDGLELRLHRPSGARAGRLIDMAGAPIRGMISVFVSNDASDLATLALDGSFRFFANPEAGPVTFEVEAEGYEALKRTIELTDDTAPVELVLVRVKP